MKYLLIKWSHHCQTVTSNFDAWLALYLVPNPIQNRWLELKLDRVSFFNEKTILTFETKPHKSFYNNILYNILNRNIVKRKYYLFLSLQTGKSPSVFPNKNCCFTILSFFYLFCVCFLNWFYRKWYYKINYILLNILGKRTYTKSTFLAN